MGTEAETTSSAGAGHAPREDASADRRARLAACLERARAGEIGALDDVVTELNPLLWHVARAEGLTVDDAVTWSRRPGSSCCGGCTRSGLRRR